MFKKENIKLGISNIYVVEYLGISVTDWTNLKLQNFDNINVILSSVKFIWKVQLYLQGF